MHCGQICSDEFEMRHVLFFIRYNLYIYIPFILNLIMISCVLTDRYSLGGKGKHASDQ